MLIAVDHGNYSIKTPNFSFVAGLAEHTVPPPILDDCIEYDGRYWTLSESRIFYMRDKTQDDRYFILTLFAIAKELEKKRYTSPVVSVDLAVGLPPEHYNMLIREKGLSPKSVKNIHGVCHRAVEQAKKLGYLKENPLEAVIVPRVEKKQIKAMEDNNMVSFLQAIKGTRYELVLFVTAFTGLRQGEVLGLTWDCVNFENNTLLINKQHNRVKGDT